jgi:uncharacterized paraquat-inducible protein A
MTSVAEDARVHEQEVRARLLEGLSRKQATRERIGLLVQVVFAISLFAPRLSDGRDIGIGEMILAGIVVITSVLAIVQYWRLRPGRRSSVSDRAVAYAIRHSRRCSCCAALMIPMDGLRCPKCGREHHDWHGVAIALAIGVAAILVTAWYINWSMS